MISMTGMIMTEGEIDDMTEIKIDDFKEFNHFFN